VIAMVENEEASLRIDRVIVDAILAGRMRPGMRLGEQALATLFKVSRTTVRQALVRLETRGLVQVSSRRGWFVVEPSVEEAEAAFRARRAIEAGILHTLRSVTPRAIGMLRAHIARQREAIASDDVSARSFLLGDFHVCMAEAFDNPVLVDILRNLTARTLLFAALYQSAHEAICSCDEHEQITNFLEAGDAPQAARELLAHIDTIEASFTKRIERDPLTDLRQALRIPASRG
jgi:DNA-binding GntR family transcriptional regulator